MVQECRLPLGYGAARYLESGDGWPLILLHGFPLNADMWRPQLERTPDGWRFIAPDIRGFGPSGTPPARTMDDMAGAVLELLDALEIEKTALGGLSMGGYLTFALLRRDPERFDKLFLADTRASSETPEGREGRNGMLALLERDGPHAVVDEMLPKLLGKSSRRRRPELEAEVRRIARSNQPAALGAAVEAIRDRPDSTPMLASISVPTLILCGEEDTLTPLAEARSMQTSIRRSYVVSIPDAGHLSSLEAPEEFSNALSDFLAAPL